MSTIRVDYANARAQAKKLQAAADDCDQVVRQLKGTLSHIPSEWDGAAADAFSTGVQKRISEISSLAANTRSLAAQIRRVADELEETERRLKAQMGQSTKGTAKSGSKSSNGGGKKQLEDPPMMVFKPAENTAEENVRNTLKEASKILKNMKDMFK